MSDTILLQICMKIIRLQKYFKIIISNPRRINYKSGQVYAEPGLTGVLFNVISLTGRGHGDSLGTVNGGVDGFTDSNRSHEKPLLPLVAGEAAFCVCDQLANLGGGQRDILKKLTKGAKCVGK